MACPKRFSKRLFCVVLTVVLSSLSCGGRWNSAGLELGEGGAAYRCLVEQRTQSRPGPALGP